MANWVPEVLSVQKIAASRTSSFKVISGGKIFFFPSENKPGMSQWKQPWK